MPEITPFQIVAEIDNYINEFAADIESIQADLYNRITVILKEISTNKDGDIKRTAANLKIISDVQKELNKAINDSKFHAQIAGLKSALQDVIYFQTEYFNQIEPGLSTPAVITELQEQSFDRVISDLTGVGIKDSLVNQGAKILRQSMLEGASFFKMNEDMKKFMIGNEDVEGRLVGYSKQIVSDVMHTNARVYNSIITDQLGLKWRQYTGALVEDSRPWCDAMVAKEWIHESELPAICRGEIDGRKVKLTGLMPDTNSKNVVERCGGFNCRHEMFPVSPAVVPQKIRSKIETN